MAKTRVFSSFPNDAAFDEWPSPVGKLTIVSFQNKLQAILWEEDLIEEIHYLKRDATDPIIKQTKLQLAEYFQGKRKEFDLPLNLNGTTFQIRAWKELCKIPYGKTISYGEQADQLGDKNKARAVGLANRCNPLSIVVPCHRVIGSNGKLVGFAGGITQKAYLLQLEQESILQ